MAQHDSALPDRPETRPEHKARPRWLGWLGASPARWFGIIIAVVAVAAAVQFGQRLERLESGSLRRLEGADRKVAELESALQRGQDQVRELQARQALIDGRIAEAQGLQAQIEKLYRGLIQESADAVLAETESALMLASQQLSLGSDPRAALAALQEIDARLVRQKDPTLGPIRRALQVDVERLKAYPAADVGSMALRIDTLISGLDQLPLSSSLAARPQGRDTAAAQSDDPMDAIFSLDHLRSELQRLIRVRRVDTPDALLLAPEQAYFLRENLRLLLLNARLGLLARNDALFRSDTERAIEWLRKYYDIDQRSVITAMNLLRQLGSSKIALDPPLPGESLRAVRAVRAARESRG
ncbi:MAG: hypothetical protein RI906_3041 [Pseudomonadota bacterium]